MVYNCLKYIRSFVYPTTCVLCGAEATRELDLCAPCRKALPLNTPCCRKCALPLPLDIPGGVCGSCLTTPPAYDLCIAPLRYQPPIDYLVRGFKFQQKLGLGKVLGELLWTELANRHLDRPELIVPVPLHPERLRQRGYNQALELSRLLSKRLQVQLDYRSCARIRTTPHQAALGKTGRVANVRGAFRLH